MKLSPSTLDPSGPSCLPNPCSSLTLIPLKVDITEFANLPKEKNL